MVLYARIESLRIMTTKKIISLLQTIKRQETTGERYHKSMLYLVRRDGFKIQIFKKNLNIK